MSIDNDDSAIPNDIIDAINGLEKLLEIPPLRQSKRKHKKNKRLIETCVATTSPRNNCKYPFPHYTKQPGTPLKRVKAGLVNDLFLQSVN